MGPRARLGAPAWNRTPDADLAAQHILISTSLLSRNCLLTEFPVEAGLQAESRSHVSGEGVVGDAEVGPHVDQAVLGEV